MTSLPKIKIANRPLMLHTLYLPNSVRLPHCAGALLITHNGCLTIYTVIVLFPAR